MYRLMPGSGPSAGGDSRGGGEARGRARGGGWARTWWRQARESATRCVGAGRARTLRRPAAHLGPGRGLRSGQRPPGSLPCTSAAAGAGSTARGWRSSCEPPPRASCRFYSQSAQLEGRPGSCMRSVGNEGRCRSGWQRLRWRSRRGRGREACLGVQEVKEDSSMPLASGGVRSKRAGRETAAEKAGGGRAATRCALR